MYKKKIQTTKMYFFDNKSNTIFHMDQLLVRIKYFLKISNKILK